MLHSRFIAAVFASCLAVAVTDGRAQAPGSEQPPPAEQAPQASPAPRPPQTFKPFVVKDIRVEGLQRTEAGTVFSYLPVKVGETMNEEKAQQALRALYATGFFSDVRLEVENDVLVVFVQERPAIAQLDFSGMREFEPDNIRN